MNYIKYHKFEKNPRKIKESFSVKPEIVQLSNKLNESSYGTEPGFIIPKIEAIHAGMTRNETYYPARALQGDALKKTGVYSWVHPYAKPVIFNHDHHSESSGRVIKAEYSDTTLAGRPGIIVYPKITLPSAIEAIKDGRLLTVSIGGECEKLTCSICGTNLIEEGMCQHTPGEIYGGKECRWEVDDLRFDELSWVNVPADSEAMITERETAPILSYGESVEVPSKKIIVEELEKDNQETITEETVDENQTQSIKESVADVVEEIEVKEELESLDKEQLKLMLVELLKEMDSEKAEADVEVAVEETEVATEEVVEETEEETKTEATIEDEEVTTEVEVAEESKEEIVEESLVDTTVEIVEETTDETTEGTVEEATEVVESKELSEMQDYVAELTSKLVEAKVDLLMAISGLEESKREELMNLSVDSLNEKIEESKTVIKTETKESTTRTAVKILNPLTKEVEKNVTEEKGISKKDLLIKMLS